MRKGSELTATPVMMDKGSAIMPAGTGSQPEARDGLVNV